MAKKRNQDGSLIAEEKAHFKARMQAAHALHCLKHGLPMQFETLQALNAIPGIEVVAPTTQQQQPKKEKV
tara:strand:- start:206 stop:415 length:210 start_codon:yes stop_codon:yes gene_type:complete